MAPLKPQRTRKGQGQAPSSPSSQKRSGTIRFHSENIDFNVKHKLRLKEWIAGAIAGEGGRPGEINIIFCDDDYLLDLNRQYLSHDTYTDIITFDYSEEGRVQKPKANLQISGDIFISVERVRENAGKFNTTFESELHRVIIHGVLHLLGYKDKSATDKSEMRKKEDYYISGLKKILTD